MHSKFASENIKERDHLEDPGTGWRKIKHGVRVWTEFIWLKAWDSHFVQLTENSSLNYLSIKNFSILHSNNQLINLSQSRKHIFVFLTYATRPTHIWASTIYLSCHYMEKHKTILFHIKQFSMTTLRMFPFHVPTYSFKVFLFGVKLHITTEPVPFLQYAEAPGRSMAMLRCHLLQTE